MAEELNTNPTPAAADAPASPVETPVTPPIIEPAPEPAVAEAMADKPIAPVEPAPVSPTPAPAPAPVTPPIEPKPAVPSPTHEPVSAVRSLLDKAKAKIQFRKRTKLDKVVAKAKEQGSITNDQVEKLLHVSDATATRYLSELAKSGRLRPVARPRAGALATRQRNKRLIPKPKTAQMVEMNRLAPTLEPIPSGGLSRFLG